MNFQKNIKYGENVTVGVTTFGFNSKRKVCNDAIRPDSECRIGIQRGIINENVL